MHDKLFNIDHLKHLCQKYGLNPTKKYGQNYLIDPSVIEQILETARLNEHDDVVEVGPGFGVLTLAMASHVKKIHAFEIEKKLEPYWASLAEPYPNVSVQWGNVLKEFGPSSGVPKKYKVVANLPYQITSAVFRLFLETANPPAKMVCMVQKEVAERICAKPGDMSLLAVAVQCYAEPQIAFVVTRASFWPAPAVDSAVIRLELRGKPVIEPADRTHFFDVVKAGFAQRRKLLIKNLEPMVGKKNKEHFREFMQSIGLTPLARAQELTLDQWKNIAQYLTKTHS